MQLVRFWNPASQIATLGILHKEEVCALPQEFCGPDACVTSLLRAACDRNRPLGDFCRQLLEFPAAQFSFSQLDQPATDGSTPYLLDAVGAEEVWGAGVTYERSRAARMTESVAAADVYSRIYEAPRPELFFKATRSRYVGPYQPVCIRSDSRWTVPEPELALVLADDGSIVGYALGNDMSARDIEGENPLYLPQAKVYTGCCSLGPVLLLADVGAPPTFELRCSIWRNGEPVFRTSTSTARMRRTFAELAAYLRLNNRLPQCTALLTGTGIVPPDDLSLEHGDVVEIAADGLGTLRNPVIRLGPTQ